jgi:hypothetical protein
MKENCGAHLAQPLCSEVNKNKKIRSNELLAIHGDDYLNCGVFC